MQPSENVSTTFLKSVWGIFIRPQSTLRDIVERRPVGQALIALISVGLIEGAWSGLAFWLDGAFHFGNIALSTSIQVASGTGLVVLGSAILWVMCRILIRESIFRGDIRWHGFHRLDSNYGVCR